MTDPIATNPLTFAYVVISVADMEQALGLWAGRFGMQVVTRRQGGDAALARAWGLDEDDIADQALLATPGVSEGGVHLVRFTEPGPAVRDGAAATDLLPKSIDIAVRDIEARYAELEAAGFIFRSPVGTLEADGAVIYEVHMAAHDSINLVFVEQPAKPEPTSSRGYGVAPQVVMISPDNKREADFLQRVLGLAPISHHRFGGPSVEKTIGLPTGASLDVRILGDPGRDFGRLELVQYEGVSGRDRYPLARAPARGQLSVTYFVADLASSLARVAGPVATDLGEIDGVYGAGRMATVMSPAGLRIDLFEHALS
jgi:catechol 2,3-dioxygenase-like lactoylglutathione lyase family enzyme